MDGARQGHDRIRRAKVGPGVSARAANDDLKPSATQSFGHDGVRTGAVEHETGADGILPGRIGKNVAHATKIAFAFLANIANEQKRFCMGKTEFCESGGYRKQRGHSGSIVGNAGPVQLSALLADIQSRSGGGDGGEVSADWGRRDLPPPEWWFRRACPP